MRRALGFVVLAACSSPPADRSDPEITGDDPVEAATGILGDRPDLQLATTHRSLTGDHLRYRRIASDGTVILEREVSVHLTGSAPRWLQAKVLDGGHRLPYALVGERRISEAAARDRARALITQGRITDITVTPAALPDGENVRAGYRAIVTTREPAHGWEVWVDGDGNAKVRRDTYRFVDGMGLVYDPNPVMQTGVVTLADNNDATSPALDAARLAVTLRRLDASGFLRGQWADVQNLSTRAMSAAHTYNFTRTDDAFEEVVTYHHLDQAQAKIQALGFMDANNRVQIATVNGIPDDNSFYDPSTKEVTFGTGGVDDAEDADIVIHEYGHSIQDNIVPGWGDSTEAGSMGEGFGDLLAATVEPLDPAHPAMIARACVGAWDATSYSSDNPPCLRRVDGTKHFPEQTTGEVHDDGEIWTAGMWSLYTALGDQSLGLKLTIEAFFALATDASFGQWSDAMIAADTAMNGGANVPAIKRTLWARGLYRIPAPPGTLTGTVMPQAVNLGPTGPLGNNVDQSLTITKAGANAIRIHFSAFDMEDDAACVGGFCDNVYVFDGQGTLYGILGGPRGASDGPIVPGNTVVVRWVTDGSAASPGFHIDRYDFTTGGVTPDAGVPDAATPDGGSGTPDAATPDAATPDAATPDAAAPDAATPDAATPDAAAPDAATADAAGPDAPVDAPPRVDAAMNPGDGDGGGCCESGRGDASVVLSMFVLGLVLRPTRRRRARR